RMSRSTIGATVARCPQKDCGAGATRAGLRGVDVRHGLIYVRRAGVRGDRRFPVRAAPGEWLLRIERGRRPHRDCRAVERGWRKNEERDGQRGPCQIDPDGVRLPVAGRVRFLFHASRTFDSEYRTVSRLGLERASVFTNVVCIRPSGHLYRKVLATLPLVRALPGMRAISAGGRALLVAGAAVLLGSLFMLPWFEVSGTRPDLPAGRYGGIGSTELVNSLLSGPWGWIAFLWLVVAAFLAIGIAALGRKTRRIGTSGIVVLLLYVLLLVVAPPYLNPQASSGTVSVSFGYGFVAGVLGAALIEAGARWPRPIHGRYEVPTTADWEET